MKIDQDLVGFRRFVGKGRSYTPRLIVRKNGQLCFNAGAVNKYELNLYEYVVIYVSENKKRAAVKFTNNEKESGLINIQKRPGNFAFSAIPFLQLYNIDYSKTRDIEFIWMNRSKIAFFNIGE
jgi:hypothetical protein